MRKTWQIAIYEYKRHVLKKRFIFALLSMPLMLTLTIGIGAFTALSFINNAPIGYVDHTGLLADPKPLPADPSEKPVEMIAFPDEDAARAALENEDIQTYYVLGTDYLESNQVELVFVEEPGENAIPQFRDFLRINLLADQPAQVAERIALGDNLVIRAAENQRETSGDTWFNSLLPMIAGFGVLILIMASSGYLMQAVAQEKENRTMEVLVTSVSPGQLIGGKVLGIVGIALTQVGTWTLFGVGAVLVGSRILELDWLQDLSIDPVAIGSMLVVLLLSFISIAAMMVAVGATVSEVQEAQQYTGLFLLPVWIPYWLAAVLIQNPNSPLAVALSLIPFTAPAAYSLRLGFANIPLWQTIASIAILTLSSLGAVWVAGRAFRLGMLRYGQKVQWREIFARSK